MSNGRIIPERSTETVTARSGALKLNPAREYLGGLSIPTMHRLIKRGLLKPNRSTRHLLFPISELDRFLRDGQS
jgi:helix-turn-helix protein